MIDRIDCGHCILNPGPKDKGRCDCYKYPVPYTFLGHDGAIFICRGWIDYIMAYDDYLERIDTIRHAIIDCLKINYPIANSDEISIGRWGYKRDGNLPGMWQQITPYPFEIRVEFMPSFYLKNLHPYIIENSTSWYPYKSINSVPDGLKMKLRRQMDVIKYNNKRMLFDYAKTSKTKMVGKRHHEILNDLLTKINKYETA